jgi:hypothetical protein
MQTIFTELDFFLRESTVSVFDVRCSVFKIQYFKHQISNSKAPTHLTKSARIRICNGAQQYSLSIVYICTFNN